MIPVDQMEREISFPFYETGKRLSKIDGALEWWRRMTSRQENPMRYTVVLEREEDGGYVASVPALPGCVSQGDTRDQALANIREAIALYVEDCKDAGDPVPTEAGKEFVEVEAA
jgi:predicted RNase H-like HicB family nuclease